MARHIDLSPLTTTLEIAARRHAEVRRREAERDLSRLELAMLLRRLGLERDAVSDVAGADDAAHLSPETAKILGAKVRGELALLARLARRSDPRYDINWHIAVLRLARWLEGGRPWFPPEPAPGSGRSRNQRFRRTAARSLDTQ